MTGTGVATPDAIRSRDDFQPSPDEDILPIRYRRKPGSRARLAARTDGALDAAGPELTRRIAQTTGA